MAIAIFGAQFTALWTAIFALGNSALTLLALESGRRVMCLGCGLTTVFLVYLTLTHLKDLPSF